jgi:ATP-dependent DNA helicase RecG
MAGISVLKVTLAGVAKLLSLQEDHFCDLKVIEISPAKLTRSISAFSNEEGEDLFIRVYEDKQAGKHIWHRFARPPDGPVSRVRHQ